MDGELTPIQRFADAFSAESPNAIEWYFPRRLTLDVDGVSSLRPTRSTRLLGLRARHASKIDIPLYAFETDLTKGRVIRGAKRLRQAREGDQDLHACHGHQAEPPRPAGGRAAAQHLPEDAGAVPEKKQLR